MAMSQRGWYALLVAGALTGMVGVVRGSEAGVPATSGPPAWQVRDLDIAF
jgi:hypothetical protein